MANLASAKKRIRSDARKRAFNDRRRRSMKKTVKSLVKLVQEKKLAEATKLLSSVYKELDKAAKIGVIKKETASRKKSRLSKMLKPKTA